MSKEPICPHCHSSNCEMDRPAWNLSKENQVIILAVCLDCENYFEVVAQLEFFPARKVWDINY